MNPPSDGLGPIFGTYDVRGVAGETLTDEVARALGAAFADHLQAGPIIVSHDMRVSSPELARAFAEGAARRGSVVGFSGLSSTDQLYCASGLHGTAGAMITASHNPARDNGVKLCGPGARPLSAETGLGEIRRRAEAWLAAGAIEVAGDGRVEPMQTLADYVDTVLELVPVPSRRSLRVVVDAANAMAGLTVPAVAERLPSLEVVPLHFTLDGTFPNHPADPTDPANLRELQRGVVREGADLGFAFDGDADRCVVVDEQGRAVPPSAVTALIATREIARARRAGEREPVVVANLVSSRHAEEAVHAAGGRRVRSRVGHSLIKALMAEHDAVFGGEHSAHYYFRDFFFADSGMLAALHLLAALAEGEEPFSALMADHHPYPASGEINSRVPDAAAATERVREHWQSVPGAYLDDLDGLTVVHWDEDGAAEQNWWFSLRASNTEPLLRLNVEAAQEETLQQVRRTVLDLVRGGDTKEDAMQHEESEPQPRPGVAGVATGADVPTWVRERLRCPDCAGGLRDGAGVLRCQDCSREIDVVDGIPVLLPREIAARD